MFQRGQKVIVVESSATGRSHPSVGDVGYLDNMYLFFRDKFILANAYFFHYRKDDRPGERCEKKRFVIDLGMRRHFRHKLLKYGVPKTFFTHNPQMVLLTTVGNSYNKKHDHFIDHPDILGQGGIWNSTKDPKLSKTVKLPYCHIALANNTQPSKYSIAKSYTNEVNAWFRSVDSVLASSLNYFSSLDTNSMHRQSVIIYDQIRKYLCVTLTPHGSAAYSISPGRRSPDHMCRLICGMRQIQSLMNIFIGRTDEMLLNNLHNMESTVRVCLREYEDISDAFTALRNEVDTGPESGAIPAIVSLFYRSIIMKHNTTKALTDMRKFLPWTDKQIEEKAKAATLMRKEANKHSAALNRIFEY